MRTSADGEHPELYTTSDVLHRAPSPTPKRDYNSPMRIDYFERNCRHLWDSDDATKALGTVNILKGVKTVGDIRKACEGHPKDSSIYPESDGSGFFITEGHGNFFAA
jgi:hypothetical protein